MRARWRQRWWGGWHRGSWGRTHQTTQQLQADGQTNKWRLRHPAGSQEGATGGAAVPLAGDELLGPAPQPALAVELAVDEALTPAGEVQAVLEGVVVVKVSSLAAAA